MMLGCLRASWVSPLVDVQGVATANSVGITVLSGPANSLSIYPPSLSCTAGGSVAFSVSVRDATGNAASTYSGIPYTVQEQCGAPADVAVETSRLMPRRPPRSRRPTLTTPTGR